jgi:hypothetical protein
MVPAPPGTAQPVNAPVMDAATPASADCFKKSRREEGLFCMVIRSF